MTVEPFFTLAPPSGDWFSTVLGCGFFPPGNVVVVEVEVEVEDDGVDEVVLPGVVVEVDVVVVEIGMMT